MSLSAAGRKKGDCQLFLFILSLKKLVHMRMRAEKWGPSPYEGWKMGSMSEWGLKNGVEKMVLSEWGLKNGAEKMVLSIVHSIFSLLRAASCLLGPARTHRAANNKYFLPSIDFFLFSRPTVSVSPTVVGSLFTQSLAKPSLSFDIHPSTSHNRFIILIHTWYLSFFLHRH